MSKDYITPKRKNEIIELAEFVASEYSIEGKAIDLEKTLLELNIKWNFSSYDHKFDGMLVYYRGKFYIIGNLNKSSKKNSPRARFTIAHELGHYFIDEHRNALKKGKNLHHPSQCDFSSKKIIEQEADLFATNLLMPSTIFQKITGRKKRKKGIEEILHLSGYFNTSVMSTALRYVQSNVSIGAVFIWNIDKSLRWYWKSEVFQKQYIGKVINNCSSMGRDSATMNAFSSYEIQTRGTTVSTVFQNVDMNDRRNALLHEEALRLGEHGVLTFIFPDGESLRYNDFKL